MRGVRETPKATHPGPGMFGAPRVGSGSAPSATGHRDETGPEDPDRPSAAPRSCSLALILEGPLPRGGGRAGCGPPFGK